MAGPQTGRSDEDDYIIPNSTTGAQSSSGVGFSVGLPVTENPTMTLLRTAREASSEPRRSNPPPAVHEGEPQPYHSNGWSTASSWPSVSPQPPLSPTGSLTDHYLHPRRSGRGRLDAPKVTGVGPTENGLPITPRGNIDDEHGSDWYRTMYRRLHTYKKPPPDHEVITVRLKRGLSHYRDDGYVSEPDHTAEERRRFGEKRWPHGVARQTTTDQHHQQQSRTTATAWDSPEGSGTYSSYRVKPKRIEDYQPGGSSLNATDSAVLRDTMYHPPQKYNPPVPSPPRPTYVFNEDDTYRMVKLAQDLPDSAPEPAVGSTQQRYWYRSVQKGHDIPLAGLRRPQPTRAPEPTVGPCPAVQSSKPYDFDFSDTLKFLDDQQLGLERDHEDLKALHQRKERELERFREESLIKRRIQEEVDQEMRRHHDTLLPAQKSPLPGNRYDGSAYETVFFTPDDRQVIMLGRAIYDFVAHTPRELDLKKGDLVYIFKKIDRNWYEGELSGRSGIFPVRYVDAFPPSSLDSLTGFQLREGSAAARFNFTANNPSELSFKVGDKLQLLRRVDHNWFEAKIGTRRGLVPENYLTVHSEPTEVHAKP